MHPAYFQTHFRVDVDHVRWPREFIIVTAYATTGETWSDDENRSANRALEGDLEALAVWRSPITGYSPESGHAEPGWAVEMSLPDARALGRRFRQDAIFHVAGDRLSVTRCYVGADLVEIGGFRERVDRAGGAGGPG